MTHSDLPQTPLTEFLKQTNQIPLVNPEALQSYFALEGLLEEVLQVFERHGPEQIQHIRTTLAEGKSLEASKAAHKLKGSCLTIGAARMSALASYLEDQLKKAPEDLQPFLPVVQNLESLFPISVSSIRELA